MIPLRVSVRHLISVLQTMPLDATIEIDAHMLAAIERGRFESKPAVLRKQR